MVCEYDGKQYKNKALEGRLKRVPNRAEHEIVAHPLLFAIYVTKDPCLPGALSVSV